MRTLFWLALAGAGFGVMAWSYFAYQRIDPEAPWALGLMVVPHGDGQGERESFPIDEDEGGADRLMATFFGLLVPIYLVQSSLGGSALHRYGRALVMNVKGNLVVAIVLAVAACYEAIEVILMSR